MSDVLVNAMLDGEVSVYACDISKMAEEARSIHGTFPVGTIILGRTIAAAVMMSAMLKHKDDRLTLMINGGGPAGTVIAVGDDRLCIKAYIANPLVNTPPAESGGFDIKGAVGTDGFVTVVKDLGLKEPYTGKAPLVSGEIGEDIAQYFLTSEQQPSIVYVNTWLETDMSVLNAGGLIVRPLPGCREETLQKIEEKISEISNFAVYIFSMNVEEVLKKIFSGMEIEVLERREPKLVCDCSKQRLEQVVISLGAQEIQDMIEKDNGAQITCRFCNKAYDFTADELEQLLQDAKKE